MQILKPSLAPSDQSSSVCLQQMLRNAAFCAKEDGNSLPEKINRNQSNQFQQKFLPSAVHLIHSLGRACVYIGPKPGTSMCLTLHERMEESLIRKRKRKPRSFGTEANQAIVTRLLQATCTCSQGHTQHRDPSFPQQSIKYLKGHKRNRNSRAHDDLLRNCVH